MALTQEEIIRARAILKSKGLALPTPTSSTPSRQQNNATESSATLNSLNYQEPGTTWPTSEPQEVQTSRAERLANAVNKGYEKYTNLPGIKQFGQVIGGGLKAASETIGSGIASTAQVLQGKNPFSEESMRAAAKNALETGQFGQEIGQQGAVAAPLGVAGRIPNALMAYSQIYGGGKELKEGLKTGDYEKAFGGALALGTGVVSGKNVTRGNQGLITAKKIGPNFENLANKIEESNLRLTPAQKSTLGNKIHDVTDFLTENKFVGSPESRFNKVNQLIDTKENRLQTFLNKEASDVVVPKEKIKGQLEILKEAYADERDYLSVVKQIDEVKNLLDTSYADEIPVNRLNNLKRSTYENAYNEAGSKVLDSVEHDIGDILYSNLQESLGSKNKTIDGVGIKDFNKNYGTMIQARKLLKVAKGRPQFGLMGRVLSSILGGAIASSTGTGPIGYAAGAIAAERAATMGGTPIKSALASGLKKASKAGKSLEAKIETNTLPIGLSIQDVTKQQATPQFTRKPIVEPVKKSLQELDFNIFDDFIDAVRDKVEIDPIFEKKIKLRAKRLGLDTDVPNHQLATKLKNYMAKNETVPKVQDGKTTIKKTLPDLESLRAIKNPLNGKTIKITTVDGQKLEGKFIHLSKGTFGKKKEPDYMVVFEPKDKTDVEAAIRLNDIIDDSLGILQNR